MMRLFGWFRPQGALGELKLLGASVLFGLLVMPPMIYLVGRRTLGEYANGGLFALWGDYFVALFRLRIPYLLVALGLYLAIQLLRAMLWGWRRLR